MPSQAVLFDLDGTLLDTARDFAYAINLLLAEQKKNPIDWSIFLEHVHGESKKMIAYAFQIDEFHPDFESIRNAFLKTYHHNCTKNTIFFPGIETVLNTLDKKNIPWGIVTSKPTWLAAPVLQHFNLDKRAACIVAGDTLDKVKPDPTPLLYACEKIAIPPEKAFYVGDLETDIIAAKAAGMKSIGVKHGYRAPHSKIEMWGADFIIDNPLELLSLL